MTDAVVDAAEADTEGAREWEGRERGELGRRPPRKRGDRCERMLRGVGAAGEPEKEGGSGDALSASMCAWTLRGGGWAGECACGLL
jgi:hypothetical protein